jgi:hypothetical protein
MDYLSVLRLCATLAVVAALYLLLVKRLADAVHPLRLKLARDGERLLASGTLSQQDADYVHFCLDNAFNGKVAFWGMFLVPLMSVSTLIDLASVRGNRHGLAPQRRASPVDPVTDLFCRSVLAANPICGAMVVGLIAMVVMIGVLVTGQLKSAQSLLRAVVDAESALRERIRIGARSV